MSIILHSRTFDAASCEQFYKAPIVAAASIPHLFRDVLLLTDKVPMLVRAPFAIRIALCLVSCYVGFAFVYCLPVVGRGLSPACYYSILQLRTSNRQKQAI